MKQFDVGVVLIYCPWLWVTGARGGALPSTSTIINASTLVN
jgi:hypothetical protein